MRLYLDTNIVVALFVAEAGSAAVRDMLRQNRVPLVGSELVRLEIIATLARKVRENELTEQQARMAAMLADQWLLTETECLQLEIQDFEAARAMLNSDFRDGLRSPDALHMSLAHRAEAILFTNDQRLLKCAAQFGVVTVTCSKSPA